MPQNGRKHTQKSELESKVKRANHRRNKNPNQKLEIRTPEIQLEFLGEREGIHKHRTYGRAPLGAGSAPP
jgi:hypothetical protein